MKRKNKSNWLIPTALFLATGLVACSHTPTVTEYPATANPTEELQKLDSDLQAAAGRQANVLSPRNYSKAADYFGDAKQAKAKGKDTETVLKKIALSRAYLNQANNITSQADSAFPEVTKARHDAIVGGALNHQKEEMSAADKDLVSVTEDVERGKDSMSQGIREKLKNRYLEIEAAAISRSRLSEARNLIDRARKQKAEKLAPKTLIEAERKVKRAEDAITTDRHNNELLDRVSTDATNEAQHLLDIVQLASQAKGESPEQIALDLDAKKKALESASKTASEKTSELTEHEKQMRDMAGANANLTEEKQFNESFEMARKEFRPDEAEVYRQGDNLLIRLKGLNFKSGSAELAGTSLPLLSKVKDVLAKVKTENVLVEGHTDSIGGRELNQKLSSERADTVAKYLVSERAIDQDKVKSEGLGFSKPLASNKSKQGRAQNRRVDVIMTLSK